MKGTIRTISVAMSGIAALALAGCAPSANSDDTISIVASTDVYGSIAESIAGDRATVTSIISNPAQDPHSYEATARDQLALAKADLVIENGGGFDPFIDTLLSSLDSPTAVVLTATDVSGLFEDGAEHDHDHADLDNADDHAGHDHSEGVNEHVWYSLEAMDDLAEEIAHHLSEIDPAGTADYEANYAAFSAQIEHVLTTAAGLRSTHEGTGIAVTELAPMLLFEEIGLVNETPAEFTTAVENGTDVAPSVLLRTRAIIEPSTVALLAFNEQTSGVETEQLVELAKSNGVAVVAIAETLPEGSNYVDWMTANLDAIADALG